MKTLNLRTFLQCVVWPLIKATEVKGGAVRMLVGGLVTALSVVLRLLLCTPSKHAYRYNLLSAILLKDLTDKVWLEHIQ